MTRKVDALSPSVIGRSTVTPDAAGVLQAISRIGYQLQEALADLIDNSIDAGARNVRVRFFRDGNRLTALAVADDGSGMDEATLEEAMRFGSKIKKAEGDLGKYGMGMKSASLNHADTLTVLTRQAGKVCGRQWTTESIRDGWKLETLDKTEATGVLDDNWSPVNISKSGTVVLWERLERFQAEGGSAGRRFAALSTVITRHLGLVFHKFLQDGTLTILLDLRDVSGESGLSVAVQPLDPFPTKSGLRAYPADFHATLGTYGDLTFAGHVWPANSADAGYKLGGRVAQRQGFYFYRNDRLIQAGGWNGWRDDAEPHSSLARVKVDLTPRFDDAFSISVQKSSLDAPPGFLETVEAARAGHTTFADYIRDAIDLYRDAGPPNKHERPIVTKGLRAGLRKQLQTALTGGTTATTPVAGVDILWSAELDPDEAFRVEHDERVIWLNDRFRNMLLDGRSASIGDVPVFKTLVFLLLGDDALKARASKKVAERHSTLNKCLLAALEDDR